MANPFSDSRTVITLDAGGTNLVFGAMRGCKYVGTPITLPSCGNDLDKCLNNIVKGFKMVIDTLDTPAAAISFAFPGPADYPAGIIGGYLPNFPAFRDGVALGPMLQHEFNLPVFINNDGDLFAYGEAVAGILPEINALMQQAGVSKRFTNLIGYTFGTGFGIGQVVDFKLNHGNNSCVETFCLPSLYDKNIMVEEDVAIRAIVREYEKRGGQKGLTTKDIADRANAGDRAALESYERFGRAAGEAIATATTLTDSVVVIGGGIAHSAHLFMPALLEKMRENVHTYSGDSLSRIPMHVFNLDNPAELQKFIHGENRKLNVYGTDLTVDYDPMKRTGIAVSKLGASQAISIGAYCYALDQIS